MGTNTTEPPSERNESAGKAAHEPDLLRQTMPTELRAFARTEPKQRLVDTQHRARFDAALGMLDVIDGKALPKLPPVTPSDRRGRWAAPLAMCASIMLVALGLTVRRGDAPVATASPPFTATLPAVATLSPAPAPSAPLAPSAPAELAASTASPAASSAPPTTAVATPIATETPVVPPKSPASVAPTSAAPRPTEPRVSTPPTSRPVALPPPLPPPPPPAPPSRPAPQIQVFD